MLKFTKKKKRENFEHSKSDFELCLWKISL